MLHLRLVIYLCSHLSTDDTQLNHLHVHFIHSIQRMLHVFHLHSAYSRHEPLLNDIFNVFLSLPRTIVCLPEEKELRLPLLVCEHYILFMPVQSGARRRISPLRHHCFQARPAPIGQIVPRRFPLVSTKSRSVPRCIREPAKEVYLQGRTSCVLTAPPLVTHKILRSFLKHCALSKAKI